MNTQYFRFSVLACALGLASISSTYAATDIEKLQAEVDELKQKVEQAAEWKKPKTLIHLAGFADVGYTDADNSPSTFNLGTFAPIFHYQFSDLVMLEGELEFEINATGATSVSIDYLTVDIFVNDYMAFVGGKFLSPLGQFRQNLHPSWINKVASAPAGFGHDQAAPNAEVGIMLRGGFPLGGNSANYAIYVGNGPFLEWDAADGEVHAIETPGIGTDVDGKKVVGGRFGYYIPDTTFEFGLSYASGKASLKDGSTYEEGRDYDVTGVDFTYRPGNFDIRGEFIKQEYGTLATSTYDTAGGIWEAWYVQAAYKFLPSKWEAVVRYGEYDTPHASQDVEQWVAGVNYLFASNVIGKVNYEFNDNPNAGQTANDRVLLQLAYGF